jgi:hypothetical protein
MAASSFQPNIYIHFGHFNDTDTDDVRSTRRGGGAGHGTVSSKRRGRGREEGEKEIAVFALFLYCVSDQVCQQRSANCPFRPPIILAIFRPVAAPAA